MDVPQAKQAKMKPSSFEDMFTQILFVKKSEKFSLGQNFLPTEFGKGIPKKKNLGVNGSSCHFRALAYGSENCFKVGEWI